MWIDDVITNGLAATYSTLYTHTQSWVIVRRKTWIVLVAFICRPVCILRTTSLCSAPSLTIDDDIISARGFLHRLIAVAHTVYTPKLPAASWAFHLWVYEKYMMCVFVLASWTWLSVSLRMYVCVWVFVHLLISRWQRHTSKHTCASNTNYTHIYALKITSSLGLVI